MSNFNRDEVGRLAALEQLDILDTPPEYQFEKIVSLVKQTLNVPICAVSLVDRDRQWFKASHGLEVSETPRDISFCTHAIKEAAPYIVTDARKHALFANNPLVVGEPHIRSYAGIPLCMNDGYNVGTLCAIDTSPREYTEEEISVLSNFAHLVVNELELRKIACEDALTGVFARRAWFEAVEIEMARAFRYRRPAAVLMMDIDYFKSINDDFGHSVGDEVLKKFADIVSGQLRPSDLFGRIGGEEFALFLPETLSNDALKLGRRICAQTREHRFEALRGRPCTVSIGISEIASKGETLMAVLGHADKALYKAKDLGRDQVVAFSEKRDGSEAYLAA